MEISKDSLIKEAASARFRPEILEKVWRLMEILDEINIHPFLKERLVLKGGTALNLFIFDLPRLSVDIDLNYIGSITREIMLQERPHVESALETIFAQIGLTVRRIPHKHAGGKWRLQYKSVLTQKASLEVDLNYMFRVPLWEIQKTVSKSAGGRKTSATPILNLHELAAGKLTALFARNVARDLFDAHHFLTQITFEPSRLRLAFVLYLAMSSVDWQKISADSLSFDEKDFRQQLLPVAPQDLIDMQKGSHSWAKTMLAHCKQALPILLPFQENEKAFLRSVSEEGEIDPSLLTNDLTMQTKIKNHPLLNWKAFLRRESARTLVT